MIFGKSRWLRPKSNGVRVDRATYKLIRSADAARGRGDWNTAATSYRAALRLTPDLPHIWVQLGHAAKESGRYAEASVAYEQAASRDPANPEPHLFLGHMAKRFGTAESAGHFLAALRRRPEDLTAVGEIMQHLIGARDIDDAFMDEALALLRIDRAEVQPNEAAVPLPDGSLFLDVTDLLSYFSFSRIPSGVQRVQIEIVLALFAARAHCEIGLCYYSPARQGWTALSQQAFIDLCAVAMAPDSQQNEHWEHSLRVVYIRSALSSALFFPKRAILVSLGANSPHGNYLLDIRTVCKRFDVRYVPVIHDLIPMHHPEWFVPAHARDFSTWLHSTLGTAGGYLAISQATKDDLLAFAERHHVTVDPDLVRVVKLHGCSVKRSSDNLPVSALSKWALTPESYTLFVSTIEPRKNHVGAFRAWLRLADEIGVARLPQFVCVGSKGWLNDEIHEMLRKNPILRRKVVLLSGISDIELDLLYKHCAFTLYPSLFEGWGLPVTEALSYAKVPAISSNSSLPEAGGDFAIYFDPLDPEDIAARIKPLILDVTYRQALEKRIREQYKVPSWTEAGLSVTGNARDIAHRLVGSRQKAPLALLGTVYRLAVPEHFYPLGGQNGEVFRYGSGWHLPDLEGCRVRETGGELRMRLAKGARAIKVALKATQKNTGYRIVLGNVVCQGAIQTEDKSSVLIVLPNHPNEVALIIRATTPGVLWVVEFTLLRANPERS